MNIKLKLVISASLLF